ncbi:spore germination protein [Aneurinibacillus uraniidurans]|uniref:spore germination protein n=1 Tax=Aneurinibacillus uraniidurans TaxID=2966586 RepID=UPI00234AB354|nr:spore germination protein [Aneurinibacillus sp. B1]WCN38279.1 spore germination protein [Aneurinibacillus sp. B1]
MMREEQKSLLSTSFEKNMQQIKQQTGKSTDLISREFCFGKEGIKAGFIYIDGMTDKEMVFRLIESIMIHMEAADLTTEQVQQQDVVTVCKQIAITVGDIQSVPDFQAVYKAILSGDTVILIEGCTQGVAVSTRGWEARGVGEPTAQTVVRGPQEGFTETLRTNTAMVRRKIKNPNLWLETKQIGQVTQTDVAMMYVKGIVADEVVDEVHRRLDQIDIDGILESAYIEELIQDRTYTPFPTVLNTERPDIVAAALLEGRVAIFVDGTPFVLLVPALFTQFLQSAEDYYHRSDFGLLRFLRYLSLLISMMAPSLYIAITTFHQEMLPTTLLISLASQREGIPFPAFVEALMMEITFELLREAGIRMPRAVGTSISIVGALVLGQAAVQAGLISPAMVIVVSITAISSFIFPSFDIGISVRMLRFILMGLAASFGLYGMIVGIIAIILHLCSLRSFGVPYMKPFSPFVLADQKDNLLRVPWQKMRTRPHLLNQKNIVRQKKRNP